MGDYHSLLVWRRAHSLALEVYKATRALPREEVYGLSVQMRRAAVSIPANLAEGCGRDTDREIVRYARISLGSASELEYYLLLCSDLEYLSPEGAESLSRRVREIKSMLAGLAASLASPAP